MAKGEAAWSHGPLFGQATLRALAAWYDGVAPLSSAVAARAKSLLRAASDANLLSGRGPDLISASNAMAARQIFDSLLMYGSGFAVVAGSERRVRETATKDAPYRCRLIDGHRLVNMVVAVCGTFAQASDEQLRVANTRNMVLSVYDLHHDAHLMEAWRDNSDDPQLRAYVGSGLCDPIPDILKNRCALIEARWWQGLLDFTDSIPPLPKCVNGAYSSISIDRIEPRIQCVGREVTLFGSFPAVQPPAVKVIFPTTQGYKEPTIALWQTDRVEVEVPEYAAHGCVWTYDGDAELEYRRCLLGPAKEVPGQLNLYGLLVNTAVIASLLAPSFDPPQWCSVETFFEGAIPTIEDLSVNGISTAAGVARVWNGRDMTITFRIYAATVASLTIFNEENNTVLASTRLAPDSTTFAFRPQFAEPTKLHIVISAQNTCYPHIMYGFADILVQLPPNVQVIGVEGTQAIQRMTLPPSPGTSNSVTLILGRTTMFRVYIDSGVAGGTDRTVRVIGTLRVGGSSFEATNNSSYVAKPVADTHRDVEIDSLNFIVPGACVTQAWLDIHVDVRVPDFYPTASEWSARYLASFTSTFHFVPGSGFKVMGILYDDARTGGTVQDSDLLDAIAGMTARLPVPDDGIELWVPADTSDAHQATTHDLTRTSGWADLVEDVGELAEDYEDDGEHWIGIVPTNISYRWGGIADSLFEGPYCTAQAGPTASTHEMCHTFGVDHAPCGATRDPRQDDPRLIAAIPDGRTEDVGVNVFSVPVRVYPAGVGDIMSYCSGDDKCTSIAVWELMRVGISVGL